MPRSQSDRGDDARGRRRQHPDRDRGARGGDGARSLPRHLRGAAHGGRALPGRGTAGRARGRRRCARSGRSVIGSVVPALTPGWEKLLERLLGRRPYVASPVDPHGLQGHAARSGGGGRRPDRQRGGGRPRCTGCPPSSWISGPPPPSTWWCRVRAISAGRSRPGSSPPPTSSSAAPRAWPRSTCAARRAPSDGPPRRASSRGSTSARWRRSTGWCGGSRREVGGKVFVLATGGLAEAVAADSQTIDRVDPALTLQGLAPDGGAGPRPRRAGGDRPCRAARRPA